MLVDIVGTDDIFGEKVEYTVTETAKVEPQLESILPDVGEVYPEYVVQFYRDVKEAKYDLAEAAKRKAELEVELKLSKSEYKEALNYLVALEKKGPTEPKPVDQAAEAGADQEDTDWRLILTETVLDGIEGMGTRKRASILDEFPSLGHLQDARAQASKAFKQFKDVLPKGIGEDMADKIENRIDDVLMKYLKDKSGKSEVIATSESNDSDLDDGSLRVDLRVFGEEAEDFGSDDDLLNDL